ncbi:hypothetical protein A8924_0298 [Saccharopolyspora erythraea NRRL 2338]|uniref:DGPFAETKE family protein n=2 Tax=Saccharopolyspora erythraea TaxID=1836 RepID=A4FQZ5_SACEN|nr:YciI family protein [Saccharopolyspora erythraea]EQD83265.1 DGPFAETKE family protein [Saccharopolyspora erythraea D]PFG93071.1 hypothetical protein A8924_0298 [Saccharopolyspora erythraea NRRL 2338]QRK89945.1 hypothetical protein JQX30_36600 [Saccharopolyspora erythraea]CAM06470.1 DGPFAETKE family protein [Saccharopolyspora erythraea NRRL 2338]
MKQYLLSIYQPDGEPPAPEVLDPIMRDVEAVNQQMGEAGAWVFAAGLHPPDTAVVARGRGAGAITTDGPYLEGKEHIGGFTVIRADDFDAALEWGRKLAAATTLPVEVRPMQDGSCG